jgi:hypothetical protein
MKVMVMDAAQAIRAELLMPVRRLTRPSWASPVLKPAAVPAHQQGGNTQPNTKRAHMQVLERPSAAAAASGAAAAAAGACFSEALPCGPRPTWTCTPPS